MAALRFGVLGALEVSVDDQPVSVPAGRRRAVLACLLVHRGRPVPADLLIDAAWGEAPPQDPAAALRTVISRLRTQLGAEAVASTPGGYLLQSGQVDADEFEAQLGRARADEPAAAHARLVQALSLWRGPAYAEHADASFAAVEAHRLDELRREAIESNAAAAIDCAETEAAVTDLEALLAAEPFRERAVELVMLALYRTGRHTAALERYTRYRQRLATELGLDPSPSLAELHSRILGHRVGPGAGEHGGIPAWLDTSTELIGREGILAELVQAVLANRVCVLTGPGGVGKSRLAAESLPRLHSQLGLPIAVAELTSVRPGQGATVLAGALGLRSSTDTVLDHLLEYLDTTPHLLVLDDCEHLLPELGHLVAQISRHSRNVRVLATSRRRLGLATELILPLPPLPVPDRSDPAGVQQLSPSVRLLLDRLRRLRPDFAVTDATLARVADLCRWSDGLPLALEFAAARVAAIGLAEVHRHLPDAALGDRSGGVQAAIARSYSLLSPDLQRLLAYLSVFPGPFTLEAVRGVLAATADWTGDAAEGLAELASASLVSSRAGGTQSQYRLLTPVRAFAESVLGDRHEPAQRAHARWCRTAAVAIATVWEDEPGERLTAELRALTGDLTAALRWALSARHTDLAADIGDAILHCQHWTPDPVLAGLIIDAADQASATPSATVAGGLAAGAFFAAERGELSRAREWGLASVQLAADLRTRATGWLALGVAAMYSGDMPEATRNFQQLADDGEYRCEAHSSLALIACYTDDLTTAREHAGAALALAPWVSDASRAFADYAAGEVALRTDPGDGIRLLQRAATEADRIGAEQVLRVSRVALLAVLVRSQRPAEAVEVGAQLLDDLRRQGAWAQIWTTVRVTAELMARLGKSAEAALLLAAAAAAPSAPQPTGPDVPRYADLSTTLTARLGPRVRQEIDQLARATPPARLLLRATHVLNDLRLSAVAPLHPSL